MNADAVLSLDQAKESLKATLTGLRKNAGELDAARASAGDDHFKLLETVGPLMVRRHAQTPTPT